MQHVNVPTHHLLGTLWPVDMWWLFRHPWPICYWCRHLRSRFNQWHHHTLITRASLYPMFTTRTTRDWKSFDIEAFCNDALGVDNDISWDSKLLEDMTGIHDSVIASLLNKFVLNRTKKFHLRPSNVWFDKNDSRSNVFLALMITFTREQVFLPIAEYILCI